MKRLLKIFGVLVILLVAAIVVLPMVFKDEILSKIEQEADNYLNAEIGIGDFGVSLFRSFPDLTVTLENTTVDGVDHFAGTRLAEVGLLRVDLNLFSVMAGSQFEIESVELSNTHFDVWVDSAGRANYDIMKSTEEDTTAEEVDDSSDEPSSFKLSLKSYAIDNLNIRYRDEPAGMHADVVNFSHDGKGDFTTETVALNTQTTVEAITFGMDGINYLSKAKLEADLNVEVFMPDLRITFKDNEVSLNELALNFDGFVAMPADDIDMDLKLSTPSNSFKSVLSLIPAVYAKDFEGVETTGEFSLAGWLKGTYAEAPEQYPTFGFDFSVNNASFHYPDLPAGVENINVQAKIENKQTNLDGMVIDLSSAKATLASSPIEARMLLKTPMSDPDIAAYLNTQFDLADIAKVVPVEGMDYAGLLTANLDLATKMSFIDNEEYDKVKADGQLKIENMVLKSDSLPYDVALQQMDLQFSPQNVNLAAFNAKLGKTDLAATGVIDNLLSYALRDETLHAQFTISSQLIDANELMGSSETGEVEETPSETDTATTAMEVVRIPSNIDATLKVDLQQLLYSTFDIKNMKGEVLVKEAKAELNAVKLNMLSGSIAMDGSYNSAPLKPEVDFDFDLKNFGFKKTFEAFEMVQKMAPIMKNTEGTYATQLHLEGKLLGDMMPDLATLLAQGKLQAKNITSTTKTTQGLAKAFKNEKLEVLSLKDVNLTYAIKDGRLDVEPFDIKAGNLTAAVSGSSGLDQTLDYDMDVQIPASEWGGAEALAGLGLTDNGKLKVKVNIGGTNQNPKVTTDLGNLAGNAVDLVKNKINDEVDKAKKEAKEKANAELAKLVKQAEDAGDKLVAAAERNATKLKAEAKKQADGIKAEAQKQADKAMAEAGTNPLKKAAAKKLGEGLVKKANETATGVENKANTEANKLVNDAKAQRQKLIDDAKAKAKIGN